VPGNEGTVVAQAGDFPEISLEPALIPALLSVFSAGINVSHALEKEIPCNILCLQGKYYNLWISNIGLLYGLLVVTQVRSELKEQEPDITTIRSSVQDFQEILSTLGMKLAPEGEESIIEPLEPVELSAEIDEQDASAIEAVFAQASKGQLDQDDMDTFWEALAEDGDYEGAVGTDGLSYEQARKLGFAPDEAD
jgi:hypothetical protein